MSAALEFLTSRAVSLEARSGRASTDPIRLNSGRAFLGELLRAIGAIAGAEIGVERGHFSAALCQAVPGLRLVCVDAWQAYPGYREHVTQEKLDRFHLETCERLAPYGCQIIRAWSQDAARLVPDGSLDFVYIDANHTLDHVIADLGSWIPKVRSGGIVAGHDYGRASVGQVREAVDAWVETHQIAPWFLLAGDRSPTWLWVQP